MLQYCKNLAAASDSLLDGQCHCTSLGLNTTGLHLNINFHMSSTHTAGDIQWDVGSVFPQALSFHGE